MTHWPELDDDRAGRWIVNPWPLAFACGIALWIMIGLVGWGVAQIF